MTCHKGSRARPSCSSDSFTLSTFIWPLFLSLSSGIFYLVSFSGVCCPLLSGHTRLFWHPPASLTTIWYSGTFIWSPSSGISCPLLSGHTMIISYGTPSFPLHYLVSYPVSLLSDRTRFFWHPPASLSLSLFWSLLSSLIWFRLLSGLVSYLVVPDSSGVPQLVPHLLPDWDLLILTVITHPPTNFSLNVTRI